MKIIGFKNASILKANISFEENQVKVVLEKGTNQSLMEVLSSIQNLSFEEKVNYLQTEGYDIDENYENFFIKLIEYIDDKNILKTINEEDFEFEEEDIKFAKKYRGANVHLIDNIKYFQNKELSTDVISMINSICNKSLTDEYSNQVINQMTDTVVYVGQNKKYEGCIGMIVETRNDVASKLVEFPGKYNDNGTVCAYWVEPKNLIFINKV